jgi:DNA topoisomerase-1
VWIAADPGAHLQATGYDARGRKQYRYHPQWRASRDAVKYHRVVALCRALPRIRAAVAHDLARPVLSKRKVVATVVSLVEHAQLRVGNDAYTRANHSYGATTLRTRHAHIRGATLGLAFRAKSGTPRRVRVTDRRLVSIVRRCRELPGQEL